MGYYQDNASDGMMFAAAAAAHQDEQEGVDEDYDPTDFLHSIGKGGGATGGSQSQPEMVRMLYMRYRLKRRTVRYDLFFKKKKTGSRSTGRIL